MLRSKIPSFTLVEWKCECFPSRLKIAVNYLRWSMDNPVDVSMAFIMCFYMCLWFPRSFPFAWPCPWPPASFSAARRRRINFHFNVSKFNLLVLTVWANKLFFIMLPHSVWPVRLYNYFSASQLLAKRRKKLMGRGAGLQTDRKSICQPEWQM